MSTVPAATPAPESASSRIGPVLIAFVIGSAVAVDIVRQDA